MAQTQSSVHVIGGGIVGLATAVELAQRGYRVTLYEAEGSLGYHSTSRCFECFRASFVLPEHIVSTMHTLLAWEEVKAKTGVDCAVSPVGYLWTHTAEAGLDAMDQSLEAARDLGVPLQRLSRHALEARWPYFAQGAAQGAIWSPSDGIFDAGNVVTAYLERARQLGVAMRTRTRVDGLDQGAGRLKGLWIDGNLVPAEQAVLAAGAFTKRLLPRLPLVPVRRYWYLSRLQAHPSLRNLPMTIVDGGAYVRSSRSGQLAFGWDRDPPEPEPDEMYQESHPELPHDYAVSAPFGCGFGAYWAEVLSRLSEAIPSLSSEPVGAARVMTGLYEVTPDHKAIIDEHPEIRGLYIAAGFSGHGVMHSAAAASLVADLVVGGRFRPLRYIAHGSVREYPVPQEAFALSPLLTEKKRPAVESMII